MDEKNSSNIYLLYYLNVFFPPDIFSWLYVGHIEVLMVSNMLPRHIPSLDNGISLS